MTSRVMTVTSPVTAVRLLKLYSVGPPSLRNASNQPFMAYSEPLKMVSISTKIHFYYNNRYKHQVLIGPSCIKLSFVL